MKIIGSVTVTLVLSVQTETGGTATVNEMKKKLEQAAREQLAAAKLSTTTHPKVEVGAVTFV